MAESGVVQTMRPPNDEHASVLEHRCRMRVSGCPASALREALTLRGERGRKVQGITRRANTSTRSPVDREIAPSNKNRTVVSQTRRAVENWAQVGARAEQAAKATDRLERFAARVVKVRVTIGTEEKYVTLLAVLQVGRPVKERCRVT